MEWTPEDIRSFKDRHKLTAESMAVMLGCNRSYIFLLMKGERTPGGGLCRLLDCLDTKAAEENKVETIIDEGDIYDGVSRSVKPVKRSELGEKTNFPHCYAMMAIQDLKKITKGDPEGLGALEEVEIYINSQKAEFAKVTIKKKKSTQ